MKATSFKGWRCSVCDSMYLQPGPAEACCICACGGVASTGYTNTPGRLCALCAARRDVEQRREYAVEANKSLAIGEKRLAELEAQRARTHARNNVIACALLGTLSGVAVHLVCDLVWR